MCSDYAAATRCSGDDCMTRTASKVRRQASMGSGCSTSRRGSTGEKRLVAVSGATADGQPFSGYEMHMGATEGPDRARPFAQLADASSEGAASADGRVSGTYIHGLFSNDRQRGNWLARFGASGGSFDYEAGVDATLDGLAAHLEKHVDLDRLIAHAQMTTTAIRPISATRIRSARTVERQRRGGCRRHWPRAGRRRPSRRRRQARRHSGAGRRSTGRARRPSPLPASRHWASGAFPRRAARRARHSRPRRRSDESRGNDQQRRQPRRRQVDQSSKRADAQPNAWCRLRAVADHAVGGVDRLVGGRRRQAADRQPERRRDDAVGEILGEALDRSARRRRLRRGARGRGRRSSTRPCGPRQARPRRAPSATAATCASRLRCASRLLATIATPKTPNGIKPKERIATNWAGMIAASSRTTSASTPAARRWLSSSLSRFSISSSREISLPIHITGWPIARERDDRG